MAAREKDASVGEMIARLRKEKKLSYADIENKGIIPAQLVEDIEKGMIGPSIGALKKICKALEIPLTDFFQRAGVSEDDVKSGDTAGDVSLVKKDERERLSVRGSRAVIEALTKTTGKSSFEIVWQEVEPKSSGGDWLTHPGEECCFVVRGEVRVHVEDATYELSEGDTLWFTTNQRHKWENPYDKPAVMMWIMTPPYHSSV
jgi:quercetin dioxygenase-like cupin family protein